MVFWETTRACDLACFHCRACAIPTRDPRELDTREGFRLLDEIAAMGTKLVVLTGGDPAKREDLVELVAHGTERGLRMALTPSATPLVTNALLDALERAGLVRLAVSIDSADPAKHDAKRGVPGAFERSVALLTYARSLGLQSEHPDRLFRCAELNRIAEPDRRSVEGAVEKNRAFRHFANGAQALAGLHEKLRHLVALAGSAKWFAHHDL